jgi:putative FmdB family regulatory protein
MPTYEYMCKECGHGFEVTQSMSDAALTDCPQCGRSALEKMISGGGFILKGGGWYVTDFKNPSGKDSGKKDRQDSSQGPSCGAGACPACAD